MGTGEVAGAVGTRGAVYSAPGAGGSEIGGAGGARAGGGLAGRAWFSCCPDVSALAYSPKEGARMPSVTRNGSGASMWKALFLPITLDCIKSATFADRVRLLHCLEFMRTAPIGQVFESASRDILSHLPRQT